VQKPPYQKKKKDIFLPYTKEEIVRVDSKKTPPRT